MYAYSNHGESMRAIDPGMEAHGEVVFDGIATEEELVRAFPWRPEVLAQRAKAALVDAIQAHLDDTAKSRGYDGILSLCSYATSKNPRFAPEGQAGVEWRDAVWDAGYSIMAACIAGKRTIPTAEELIKELPSIHW